MDRKKNQRWTIALLLIGCTASVNVLADQPSPKQSTTPNQWSVPEVTTTPDPKSRLGMRVSERGWVEGQDRFIGPVLQLLPPQMTQVVPPSATEVTSPLGSSAPRMVTRADAELKGFRTTWEAAPVAPVPVPNVVQSPAKLSTPLIVKPSDTFVLQPPMQKSPQVAGDPISSDLPSDLPPGLIANPAFSVATRAKVEPQPLRDPVATVTAPPNSAAMPAIGSGVQMTVPTGTPGANRTATPGATLPSLQNAPASTPIVTDEAEMQRLAQEVATILQSRMASQPETKFQPSTKAVTRPAHPAEDNEPAGDGPSSDARAELAVPAKKPTMSASRGEEIEFSGPELKPSIAPERAVARDSVEADLKATKTINDPAVSRVPLKSIEIQSPMQSEQEDQSVTRGELKPLELDEESLEELEALEQASPSPKLLLANLDATGRPKTHEGRTAVATLDPAIIKMQRPIQQCLQYYYGKRENADSRSHWGMMHAIMVYGSETRLIARGREYSTIAWMAGNNVCRGQRLMTVDQGKIAALEGVGLQGHQAQWLAIMSLVGVPSDYPLYVGRTRFSVADLVQTEAAACADGKELTFTLIGLSHYLDTDTSWRGVGGETWDFPRLIASELDQPVVGAACGGTHRLMSFAHSLRKRRLEGRSVDNQWVRAEMYLDDFVDYTYKLQNRDGSFSTAWFEASEDNGNLDRKIQTTGHMTEFLLTHLPDERLVEPEVIRAVQFMLSSMLNNRNKEWEIGPKGHALRALAMFYERAYGEGPAVKPVQTAARTQQRRR